MPKIETLLKRAYEVDTQELEPCKRGFSSPGVRLYLYDKNDEGAEPLGCFIKLHGCITYQWQNFNTNIETGTAYDEEMLKKAIKVRAFDSKYSRKK